MCGWIWGQGGVGRRGVWRGGLEGVSSLWGLGDEGWCCGVVGVHGLLVCQG
jgi:hypothetical protein